MFIDYNIFSFCWCNEDIFMKNERNGNIQDKNSTLKNVRIYKCNLKYTIKIEYVQQNNTEK